MKTCKLLALVLSALMLVGMLVGCGGGATTEVTFVLQIEGQDTPMFDQKIAVKDEAPTVGDIVEEVAMSYGLNLEWTDLNALSMSEFPDQVNEDGTYDMWICEINGAETKGRARETEVKAGDKIVYTYTHYTPVEE